MKSANGNVGRRLMAIAVAMALPLSALADDKQAVDGGMMGEHSKESGKEHIH